jgi:hypothetical protein
MCSPNLCAGNLIFSVIGLREGTLGQWLHHKDSAQINEFIGYCKSDCCENNSLACLLSLTVVQWEGLTQYWADAGAILLDYPASRAVY